MATYVIGDVQGCRAALEDVLSACHFDPAQDRVYFAGDLVARGPDSLGTLRLIRQLGSAADSVLGNHDLNLLAVAHGAAKFKPKDRTEAVLQAPDTPELLTWLTQRPLLIELPEQHLLTHAGLWPTWSAATAIRLAREAEQQLRSPALPTWLAQMYGNTPDQWSESLTGADRLRFIINAFTRLRMLTPDGRLELRFKEHPDDAPAELTPWYIWPNPELSPYTVVFGHWAALQGRLPAPQAGWPRAVATDTGCVWGGHLTAWRLEDGQRFHSRPGLQ